MHVSNGRGKRNQPLDRLCGVSKVKDIVLSSFVIFIIQVLATITVTIAPAIQLKSTYLISIFIYILIYIISLVGLFLFIAVLSSVPNCRLIHDKIYAILTLVFSSIPIGVSAAYFVVYLIILLISKLGVILLALVPTMLQIILILLFSGREVDVLGGDLTVVAIGVLAMAMGMALFAIQLLNSTINFSIIASPIVSAGLILIATGLQHYNEQQRAHTKQ